MELSKQPYEILLNIIYHLPVRNIIGLCHTNTQFNRICKDNFLWAKLADEYLSFPIEDFYAEGVSPLKRYLDIERNS